MNVKRLAAIAVAVLGMAALGPTVLAAQTGTVEGLVAERGTGIPLTSARVYIVGTGLGVPTDGNGRYRIGEVPAGRQEVRVEIIGYNAMSTEVTVVATQTVEINYEMQHAVLSLDEIVVTGTAGQARRREIGNGLAQVNLADVVEPVDNVALALQGQAAGVAVMESGGMSGTGRQIRLRGNVSVAMSNQPLIYVDGVRLRSEGYPAPEMNPGSSTSTNEAAGPLNDIDPNDIERIEVIKGAAATTLYGTEAAAGVIQIFTKRGQAGRAVWTGQVDQGFSSLMMDIGPPWKAKMALDPWLQAGWRQAYSLSVGGGTESLRYLISGAYHDNTGIVPSDYEERGNFRANLSFTPVAGLQVDWNNALSQNYIQNISSGNNANGLGLNTYRTGGDPAPRNYVQSDDPAVIDSLFDLDHIQRIFHLTTGLTLRYQPWSRFTNRITFGFDRVENEGTTDLPFGFITQPLGARSNTRWQNEVLTVDYVGNYELELGSDIGGTLSLGGQWVETEERQIRGWSENFPGPGEPTLTSGAIRQSDEEILRVINAGFFGQALFGLKDRYFVTAGVRVDGNSAFGEALGLQVYPKISGSYVVSDEEFWPESMGRWKLRFAYGSSGRAPGAFDAVRTWDPVGWGPRTAFWPSQVGNSELGPERTREIEMGAEGTILGDRVSVDFTYYNQQTTDALFPVLQIPTEGFVGSQLENVGEIKNVGVEMQVNGVVLDKRNFGWDLGVQFSTNHSQVINLGGAAPFLLSETGWIFEGEPVPVMRGTILLNPDELADPETEIGNYGPNRPTLIVGLNTEFRLPGAIRLSARGEYMGGHYVRDRASRNMGSRGVWAPCQGPGGGYELLAAGRESELTAYDRLWCDRRNGVRDNFNFPADFFKLRHITLHMPLTFIPWGTTTFTASIRNLRLYTHEDFQVLDPEMAGQNGFNSAVRAIVEHIPPPQQVMFSLRAVF
ncbi:MAG: TonB-dependent receptor domain-containing protein [Planctomycetota bacterium]|jgi:TonB-dependent SusC/RagA subfamily outer membrane receptor